MLQKTVGKSVKIRCTLSKNQSYFGGYMPNTPIIVKDNSLIEFRGHLTEYEQKLMNWCAVQIAREDTDFEYCWITTQEAGQIFSKHEDPVSNPVRVSVQQLSDIIGGLYKNSILIRGQGEEYERHSLILKDGYKSKEGAFRIKFSEQLKPYLLQLKRNFTKLDFVDMMGFRHAHTQRFYEMSMMQLKGGHTAQWEIEIEELKLRLGLEDKYKRWDNFEKKVLQKSQDDLKKIGMILTWVPDRTKMVEAGYLTGMKRYRSYQRVHFQVRITNPQKTGAWRQIASFGFDQDEVQEIFKKYGKEVVLSVLKRWGREIGQGEFDSGTKIESKKAMFRSKLADMKNEDKQLDIEYDQEGL